MQLTLLAVFSFMALAIAAPTPAPVAEGKPSVSLYFPSYIILTCLFIGLEVREPVAVAEPVAQDGTPAMTDADGNIVDFDSTNVYLPAVAAGQ